MKHHKYLWIMVLVFSLFLLVSCNESNETTTTPLITTAEVTTTTPLITTAEVTTTEPIVTTEPEPVYENYPEHLLNIKSQTGGKVVTFAYLEPMDGKTYTADSIWMDSEADDQSRLDAAIIKRNQKIYEDLGVTIRGLTDESLPYMDMYQFTKQYFDSQDPTIDVYCGSQVWDILFQTEKHLCRIDEIKSEAGTKLLDLTASYWNKAYIDTIAYNSNVYFVTGDLSLRYTGGLFTTFVNTDIYDVFVKSHYDNRDIFDIVENKEWTLDTMLSMAAYVGDGKKGILCDEALTWDALALGSMPYRVQKYHSSEGIDSFSNRTKYDDRSEALADYFTTIREAAYSESVSGDILKNFAKGEALFAVSTLNHVGALSGTNLNFTVIPVPKLNGEQEQYATGVYSDLTLFGISNYSDCKVAAAATLELMAYCADLFVSDRYYESEVLSIVRADEKKTKAMIDLMHDTIYADFTYLYMSELRNIAYFLRKPNCCKNYSTEILLNNTSFERAYQSLVSKLETIEEK